MRVRVDIGAGASLGSIAGIVSDISTTADLALRVDWSRASQEARAEVERDWAQNPQALFSSAVDEDEGLLAAVLEQRRQAAEALNEIAGVPLLEMDWEQRLQYEALLPYAALARGDVPLQAVAPELFARLAARAIGGHLPATPVVERLSYDNPLDLLLWVGAATSVVGTGLKSGAFVDLLKMARDWSADRRRSKAEADKAEADARLTNARASSIEFETELKRRLAAQVGDPTLSGVAVSEGELAALRSLSTADLTVDVTDD